VDEQALTRDFSRRLGVPVLLRWCSEAALGPAWTGSPDAHRVRINAWRRGRAALAEVVAALGRTDDCGRPGPPDCGLSLAHSGSWAVAAGRRDAHPVGVDLEQPDRVVSEAVLRRMGMLAGETRTLGATDHLVLWTALEAVHKARGTTGGLVPGQIRIEAIHRRAGRAWVAGQAFAWCARKTSRGMVTLAVPLAFGAAPSAT